ncbi:MAG TPA: SDR family oxidoreductase [Woeseiaceae bacterium]
MRGMKVGELSVLLTGASGGIGRAVALALARRGATLVVTSRNAARLEQLCEEIRAAGGRAHPVAADLTAPDGRRRVIAEAASHGPVSVLINNAGTGAFGEFARQGDDDIERVIVTNVLATMLLTRSFLPLLKQRRGAVIVNVGSILGSLALPGQVAYSASKFAVRGFTEGLRRELAGSSVRVVYVAPRATDTPMNGRELRRFNERFGVATDLPERVGEKIARAVLRASGERYFGWPEKLIVRLNALLPAIVDRALRKQAQFVIHHPDESEPPLVLPQGAEQ